MQKMDIMRNYTSYTGEGSSYYDKSEEKFLHIRFASRAYQNGKRKSEIRHNIFVEMGVH